MRLLLLVLGIFTIFPGISLAQEKLSGSGDKPAPGAWEARLLDDSQLKVTLIETTLTFDTPYGKLTIPTKDIYTITLGIRITDETQKLLETAIDDLGASQFKRREQAMETILKHRQKAFYLLKKKAKSSDAEVSTRIESLLETIEKTVPGKLLQLPEHDTIQTEQSKIVGRIVQPSVKVETLAFGEQSLKLSDVLTLSTKPLGNAEVATDAIPDPGSLQNYQGQIGKTLSFRVTGKGNGSLWGTEFYTLDSTLAMAAVHMGILKEGQTGIVKVVILGPMNAYVGSTQNGIASQQYAQYPGTYQILKK